MEAKETSVGESGPRMCSDLIRLPLGVFSGGLCYSMNLGVGPGACAGSSPRQSLPGSSQSWAQISASPSNPTASRPVTVTALVTSP